MTESESKSESDSAECIDNDNTLKTPISKELSGEFQELEAGDSTLRLVALECLSPLPNTPPAHTPNPESGTSPSFLKHHFQTPEAAARFLTPLKGDHAIEQKDVPIPSDELRGVTSSKRAVEVVLPPVQEGIHSNHIFSCCSITAEIPEHFMCLTSRHTIWSPSLGYEDGVARRLRGRSRELMFAFVVACGNADRFDLTPTDFDVMSAVENAEFIIVITKSNRGEWRPLLELRFAVARRCEYVEVPRTKEVDTFDEMMAETEFECEYHELSFKIVMYGKYGSLRIPEDWRRRT